MEKLIVSIVKDIDNLKKLKDKGILTAEFRWEFRCGNSGWTKTTP